MIRIELTCAGTLATTAPMNAARRTIRLARVLPLATLASAALGGCVNVTAPDKPIVIELNVNIRQEVIYRLAEDVRQNIDENPEIF